jgi:hypothetical protein
MRISTIKLFCVLALGLVICLPGLAMADTTLSFDDVPGGVTGAYAAYLPTDYAGFTWSSTDSAGYWGVINNAFYRTDSYAGGNNFDFPSNPNVIINETGPNNPAFHMAISRSTAFNLISAYFAPWTVNDANAKFGATSVTLTGWLGSNQVGDPLNISLSAGALQFQNIGFNHIDRVTIDANGTGSAGLSYFLMDNMVYTNAPIPASVLLLGSGLLGLGLVGWRRQRS